MATIDAVRRALAAIAHVCVEEDIDGRARGRIVGYAPDVEEYGGSLEPGDPWDEKCDQLLDEVRAALPPGWSAIWLEDDVIIERDDDLA